MRCETGSASFTAGRFEDNPAVGCDSALVFFMNNQGIDVHFLDFGVVDRKVGESDQAAFESSDIPRRPSADSLEE